jgi:NitT/TauT family transport system ATP-binding protein
MEAPGEVRLSVVDCVVQFGDMQALGPISLSVKAGECVVLLGPSGCGKSTLLSVLAGLQPIKSGDAVRENAQRPAGFVFQDPNLMPWANVRDNVALPLALVGRDKPLQNQMAQAALDRVGLGAFAAAKPRTLSGGMAMRVALARALVDGPTTLLLDEPFGAIDELGRRELNDLVHSAKHGQGIAILFVTHSVEEAVYMADRILVMSPRPGTITDTIAIPDIERNAKFLVSPEFGALVIKVRTALARAMGETT